MNVDGQPLLHVAIRTGEEDLVAAMLANPTVDVNLPAIDKTHTTEHSDYARLPAPTTIVDVAEATGNERMMALIAKVPGVKRPYAIRRAWTPEELETKGIDVFTPGELSESLRHAVQDGESSVVATILTHLQAHPSAAADRAKYLAVLAAYSSYNSGLGDMILRSGIPHKHLNARTKEGSTILSTLCEKPYDSIITYLVQTGLCVNVKRRDGWTPLGLAAKGDRRETVRALLASPHIEFVTQYTDKGRRECKAPPYCYGLIETVQVKRVQLKELTRLCLFGRTRAGRPLRTLPSEVERLIASYLIPDPERYEREFNDEETEAEVVLTRFEEEAEEESEQREWEAQQEWEAEQEFLQDVHAADELELLLFEHEDDADRESYYEYEPRTEVEDQDQVERSEDREAYRDQEAAEVSLLHAELVAAVIEEGLVIEAPPIPRRE